MPSTFLSRSLSVLAIIVGIAAPCAAGAADLTRIFPGESWSTREATAPSAWSAEKLKHADELAASLKTDAYLVVHGGQIVHAYGDIGKPMNLASVRKSVMGILYGMQVERGVIRLDETLEKLGIDDKEGLSATEKSATVRQLLQSRSGVYHPAAYETPRMKATRPARGSQQPGASWYYNNWDFNVLGTVFERRTGKTVFEALQADLATPLQFEDFRPSRDTESVLEPVSEHAADVMRLSARDLARIGVLMARQGRWAERQIVSPRWLAQSTRSHTAIPRAWFGYGYLWWTAQPSWTTLTKTSPQSFMAIGHGGQFLLIDPPRDLVVVHRIDNSKLRFLRGNVSLEQFTALLGRILAAAPGE